MRRGKINASALGEVVGITTWNRQDTFDRLRHELHGMEYPRGASNAAMEWGVKMEPTALRAYTAYMKAHKGFDGVVTEEASVTHPQIPWLAASPDGLVGDDGLVEIKCPFSKRDVLPRRYNIYDSYRLQVIQQLAVTGRVWCDICVWTTVGMYIERVYKDETFFEEMRRTYLEPYYTEALQGQYSDQEQKTPFIRVPTFDLTVIRRLLMQQVHDYKEVICDSLMHTELQAHPPQ